MHDGGDAPPEGFSMWALRMIYYFLFVVGLVVAITINYERGLFTHTSEAQVARFVEPLAPAYDAPVTLTGTMVYGRNNMGERIPYIRYDTPDGVMMKALLLSHDGDLPPSGSIVTTTGLLEYEHIRVLTLHTGG